LNVTIDEFVYISTPSEYVFFDNDLQYMVSMIAPEKQKIIIKDVAEILRILLSE